MCDLLVGTIIFRTLFYIQKMIMFWILLQPVYQAVYHTLKDTMKAKCTYMRRKEREYYRLSLIKSEIILRILLYPVCHSVNWIL